MPPVCITRALENVRHIQAIAPHIISKEEPRDGYFSLISLDILSRFHLMQEADFGEHTERRGAVQARSGSASGSG